MFGLVRKKIICPLYILSLAVLLLAFSFHFGEIFGTVAYSSDVEKSENNLFQAGTWDDDSLFPQPGDIILNEIMWMGSKDVGSPSYDGPDDQWVEIKNVAGKDLHMDGVCLYFKNAVSGNENKFAEIGNNRIIMSGGYFLLSNYLKNNSAIDVQRDDDMDNFGVDKFQITMYTDCEKSVLLDTAGDGSGKPTKGDDVNFSSMERNVTPGNGSDYANWHTNSDPASTTLYWDLNRTETGSPAH